MSPHIFKISVAASALLALSGCSTLSGLNPFSGGSDNSASSSVVTAKKGAPQLGVNGFLWRASLETLDFMPLAEVDPIGGVIVTDWHSNPGVPGERFKANVYILDSRLRADALKVSIFKQSFAQGTWSDAPTDGDTARQIENAILTKARELHIASGDR